ncbi:MAG: hypothetical protein HC880_02955 [Bacteroidia bacterium]|nr:hypothetical protein [Bacteroidia bacterium]
MTKNQLTAEQEKELIQTFFDNTRQTLRPYFEDRGLNLSNSQLFAFVMISPITIAIASDGNLDFMETSMLVDIAAYFDRDILPAELDHLNHPPNIISNREFKRVIFGELRYLCLSMNKYEEQFIQSIRDLIRLDETVSHDRNPEYSVRQRVSDMMHSVIHNNLGIDTIEEKKMRQVMQALGIR